MGAKGASELQRFSRAFGEFPKDLRKAVRPLMRKTGQRALEDAKKNASWSRRIPDATRLTTRFTRRFTGVAIVTNKNKAPHARPHENRGREGYFRHPFMGNRRIWYAQRARPFQMPAATKWYREINEDIGKMVDDLVRPYRYK